MSEAWGDDTAEQLQPKYEKLYDKIGARDFIWCFTEYEHWKQLEIRKLWVLDVPRHEVLKWVDSGKWKTLLDPHVSALFEEEAWRRLFVRREEALCRTNSGRGGSVCPILTVPIQTEWVVDNTKFNKGPAYGDAEAKYDELPTSECEARRCRRARD